MTGALTATYIGKAVVDSAAFKTLIDAINSGAATAGADTTSIIVIPLGVSGEAAVWKYARAA